MGKVISVINMKGGVGKTTLTKELGYFMAKNKNKKVLFIDLDPQSNLTQSFFLNKKLRHQEDLNEPKQNLRLVSQSIQKLFDSSSIGKLKDSEVILNLEQRPYSRHIINYFSRKIIKFIEYGKSGL